MLLNIFRYHLPTIPTITPLNSRVEDVQTRIVCTTIELLVGDPTRPYIQSTYTLDDDTIGIWHERRENKYRHELDFFMTINNIGDAFPQNFKIHFARNTQWTSSSRIRGLGVHIFRKRIHDLISQGVEIIEGVKVPESAGFYDRVFEIGGRDGWIRDIDNDDNLFTLYLPTL